MALCHALVRIQPFSWLWAYRCSSASTSLGSCVLVLLGFAPLYGLAKRREFKERP